MARVLIVGCGCRGRELAGRLALRDWQVRGTSRTPAGLAAIQSSGVEPAAADPDRPGTVLDLCGDVSVVVWLLGCADGAPDTVAAVHGPRLERLLEKLVDSPVRGFAYEAGGTAGAGPLRQGREIVERAGGRWRIPVTMLGGSREEPGWAERSAEQVAALLAVR
jgi:nucleoside-diphosphate-sugar epimerase